ncbi:MAG: Tfp pilus assembly protein FimT/FimU [bacterium]
MRYQQGITQIEIIIIVCVIAILSTLAIPSINGWLPRFDFNSQIAMLHNDFQLARFKAIGENSQYKIKFTLSTTAQDSYTMLYYDEDSGTWKIDNDIRYRKIKKSVDIAYIDSSVNNSGTSTDEPFAKEFYPDGSYGGGTILSEGEIYLQSTKEEGLKKKIIITPATGFIRVEEGWD